MSFVSPVRQRVLLLLLAFITRKCSLTHCVSRLPYCSGVCIFVLLTLRTPCTEDLASVFVSGISGPAIDSLQQQQQPPQSSTPPHLHVTNHPALHLLPSAPFLTPPLPRHPPTNVYQRTHFVPHHAVYATAGRSTSRGMGGRAGFYGAAVASMPDLHTTRPNVPPVTPSRLLYPHLYPIPPLPLPPPLLQPVPSLLQPLPSVHNMESAADRLIHEQKERLANEVEAEIELELGNGGKTNESEESADGDGGEGSKEGEDSDVGKRDERPSLEVDVRKLSTLR